MRKLAFKTAGLLIMAFAAFKAYQAIRTDFTYAYLFAGSAVLVLVLVVGTTNLTMRGFISSHAAAVRTIGYTMVGCALLELAALVYVGTRGALTVPMADIFAYSFLALFSFGGMTAMLPAMVRNSRPKPPARS